MTIFKKKCIFFSAKEDVMNFYFHFPCLKHYRFETFLSLKCLTMNLFCLKKKPYFSITVLQRTMRIRIQINEKYAENTYKNIINLLKQNYWWKIHAHLFVAEDWGKPTKKFFVCMVSPVKFDIISVLIHKDRQKVFFLFRKKSNKSKASKLLTHK